MRIKAKVGYDRLSMNVLELFDMVWTTYVMTVTRKELPEREGEVVLMRGHNASAVQWVLNCVRARGVMRILGVVEVGVKWRFQVKHVAGVDNSLADLIICCENGMINAGRKHQTPDFNWH